MSCEEEPDLVAVRRLEALLVWQALGFAGEQDSSKSDKGCLKKWDSERGYQERSGS